MGTGLRSKNMYIRCHGLAVNMNYTLNYAYNNYVTCFIKLYSGNLKIIRKIF